MSTKNIVLEYEISIARIENTYGNNLLQLEKLKNLIEIKKTELLELTQKNTGKEKQIDELQKETKKYEAMIGKSQTKLLGINKLIEQVVHFFLLLFLIQNIISLYFITLQIIYLYINNFRYYQVLVEKN